MKQLFKYPGSKWKIAQWIINHFPPHKIYVEPFFGSGAVFFTKYPNYLETINDIDGRIVNLFKVCREHPNELASAIELTPWSRAEYINCAEPSDNEIEWARRTIVRFAQSHSGCAHLKSWRTSQVATSPPNPHLWNGLPDLIIEVCKRLKDAQIENKSAERIIEVYNNTDSLIYLDPPYPLDLRCHELYDNEMTDNKHRDLLELIKMSKAKICISSYKNSLYDEMLKGWVTDSRQSVNNTGQRRTEILYMNFQPPLLAI